MRTCVHAVGGLTRFFPWSLLYLPVYTLGRRIATYFWGRISGEVTLVRKSRESWKYFLFLPLYNKQRQLSRFLF